MTARYDAQHDTLDRHEEAPVWKPAACPKCDHSNIAPILYGIPSQSARALIASGKAIAGGCVLGEESPMFACLTCEHRWFDPERPWYRV